MYETFFNLQRRPFAAPPQVESNCPHAAAEQARVSLIRAIDRAAGPGVLIGAAGVGKTLLLQLLAQHFRGRFQVALLASASCRTRRALLQNILFELGLPYRGLEEGELRLSLIDYLAPGDRCPQGLLLLVDEAHALPLRLLEEIRLITNLVRDGQPRVRLVLAGSAVLEERLASPKLESFQQRIAARCYLEHLHRDDTAAYVAAQLAAVGGDVDDTFTPDALSAIYHATDGVPRLINQVCDQALLLASLGHRRTIDADGVQEAWADLQQLPGPWRAPAAAKPAAAVVEFGQLDAATMEADSGSVDQESATAQQPAAEFDTVRAVEARLDQIEAAVAAAQSGQVVDTLGLELVDDEEFEPAGFIGPEIELNFLGPFDPFAEAFAEEEIVIDHYATLDAVALAARPHVSSSEGREIAAALAHAPASESRPTLSVVGAGEVELFDGGDDDLTAIEVNDEDDADFDPASDPVYPEAAPAASDFSDDPERESVTIAASAGGFLANDDRDLIIIEDEPAEPRQAPKRPAAAARARRQEYRQLFARLRRG